MEFTLKHKVAFFKYKQLSTIEELISLVEYYFAQKIWMPPLSSLNDPFEGQFKFEPPGPEKVKKDKKLFDFFYDFFKENSDDELTEEEFKKMLISHDFKKALEAEPKELVNFIYPNFSAFSLAGCACSIPMWSHYASNQHGYCLIFEFDFSEIVSKWNCKEDEYINSVLRGNQIVSYSYSNDMKFVFGKIKYVNIPPTIVFDTLYDIKKKKESNYEQIKYLFNNAFGVKFKGWDYENEYRLICSLNSKVGGVMDLKEYAPFLKIAGVIMGKNLSLKNKNIFKDLCRQFEIDLYQADFSKEEYKIKFVKISDYGKETELLAPISECQCLAIV